MAYTATRMISGFYTPSGRYDTSGLLLLPLALVLGAPIAAAPYILTIWYEPAYPVPTSGALFYGIFLAAFGAYAVTRCRMRCPGLVLGLAVPSVVVGHFLALTLWLGCLSGDGALQAFSRGGVTPGGLAEAVLSPWPRWSDPGKTGSPSSWPQDAVYWAFEFLVCVGMTGLILWGKAKQPFSEYSQRWFAKKQLAKRVAADAAAVERVKTGGRLDATTLLALSPLSEKKRRSNFALILYTDDSGNDCYLSGTLYEWPRFAICPRVRRFQPRRITAEQARRLFEAYGPTRRDLLARLNDWP